ncbi:hypothetical protein D3C86_1951230 [compost metagenome]
MQEILGPGRQRERERQAASGSDGSFDTRHSMIETIDRSTLTTRRVFDGTTDGARLCRAQNAFRAIGGVVGKTIFKVHRHR